MAINSFVSNDINYFCDHYNNIRHFEGFRTQVFLVCEAIRYILHFSGDRWRHATDPFDHIWRASRQ